MHHRSTRVSGLVFGAIMASLVVVFALIPVLGLFLPIPLVLAYIKYGPRITLLTATVAVGFTMLFTGPLQAFLLIPAGVLPGLVFGYGFRKGLRPMTIGLIAVAVFFLGFAAQYAVTRVVLFDGEDPFAQAASSETGRAQMERILALVEPQMVNLPDNASEATKRMAELQRGWVQEFRDNPVPAMWTLLPLSVFMIGALSTWLNYMLCRWILPRFGHDVPAPTPFAEFRLPVWLIWVYVLVLVGTAFVDVGPTIGGAHWSFQVVLNVLPPLSWVFILAGVAVAYGYLRRKEVPPLMAGIFSLVGLLVGGVGIQIYMMLAILDSILDFRRLGHGLYKRSESTP